MTIVACLMQLPPDLIEIVPAALSIGIDSNTGEMVLAFITIDDKPTQEVRASREAVIQLHGMLHHMLTCETCSTPFQNLGYTPAKHSAH